MADRYAEFRDKLPRSYVEFIESDGGWEGDLGDELVYAVVWDRQSIQDRWDSYDMAQCLSDRWFPFGSDGGGEMLCFDLASCSDKVFWIPYVGMSEDDAMEQSFCFSDIVAAIRKAV